MNNLIICRTEQKYSEGVQKLYMNPSVFAQTLHLPSQSNDNWKKWLGNIPDNVHSFVAVIDEKVVGNIALRVETNERRRHIGNFVIAVSDQHQGQGIGKVRRLILNDFLKAFESCDIIATPTAPTVAYKLGENLSPAEIYMGDVYTIGVNLAGLPSLSHPVGFVGGLPVGLQLIGKHWAENTLLNTTHAYQGATEFHKELSPIAKG